jgi:hypothetical protein
LFATLLMATAASVASAQQTLPVDGRQFPLNQYTPPGTVGRWSVQAGRVCPGTFQQVRILLPSSGTVTAYNGSPNQVVSLMAPAQMGLLVGTVYRFKIEGMPEFPNQEFYPSIELLDQLHPPPGQADRFPVEIELLVDELTWATNGRLVTKVVYLEQPDRVPLRTLNHGPRVTDLEPAQNALAEADVLGRPIAIVRLGGRVPDAHAPDPQFWRPLAPIQVTAPAGTQPRTVQFRPAPHGPITVFRER